MTKQEMIEVMDMYIAPLYQILGGIAALLVIVAAWYLVIFPFLRKVL